MTIPGTDGQKMSKSYGNTIDIFQPEKALKKNIMQIVTDSKELEDPKNPDEDNVFALYSLIATEEQTEVMRENYEGWQLWLWSCENGLIRANSREVRKGTRGFQLLYEQLRGAEQEA